TRQISTAAPIASWRIRSVARLSKTITRRRRDAESSASTQSLQTFSQWSQAIRIPLIFCLCMVSILRADMRPNSPDQAVPLRGRAETPAQQEAPEDEKDV